MNAAADQAADAGLYADAAVYDVLMTPGTARELDVLERLARTFAAPARRPLWLEPACGTGRLLRLAAARGARAWGFDRAPGMVAYARAALVRRGLHRRAHVFLADLTDFADAVARHSVDFAFTPHNTIRHLDSDTALLAHLAGIARVLKPSGVYAIGLSLTDYAGESPDEDVWTARRGGLRVTQIVNYLPPGVAGRGTRRERVISHLMVTRGATTLHRDCAYDLRCWSERQWNAVLRHAPLRRVASLDASGRLQAGRRLPYQFEVLATK